MKKKSRALAFLLMISMLALPAGYRPQASIQNQINSKQQEIKRLKDKYSATQNAISDVQKKKQEMEDTVRELDNQLSEAES